MSTQCDFCKDPITPQDVALGITVYDPHRPPFSETVAWFCRPMCLTRWVEDHPPTGAYGLRRVKG